MTGPFSHLDALRPDERLVEAVLALCRIPSPTGEEGPLCDALERWTRERAERLAAPARRHGHSLVVPLTRRGGPHIVLAGHTDVVRTAHDGPPRVEGDRIYGAGASDMKSGLALMMELLFEAPPPVDVTLVFYAREEGPFAENELGPVLAEDPELARATFAVCLEPSDNRLSLGASGSLHAEVVFHGKTAHSARPWQGKNAIHEAGALLAELAALAPRESTVDGFVYRTVTSATLASGGRGRNVIPDRFSLNLNHRFPPGTDAEAAKAEVVGLVGGRAEVTFTDVSPSAPTHRDHPLVRLLEGSGARGVEPKQAWTDVARFAALGVPAVNFGPGVNAQAHQPNEWTSASLLLEGREILRRFLSQV